MGARFGGGGGRGGVVPVDPDLQQYLRNQFLTQLGGGMMGSPDPRAIGASLQGAVAGLPDARRYYEERVRQQGQDRLAEEWRQSQIAENQRQAQSYRDTYQLELADREAKKSQADLALRSKQQLLERLRAESPEEAAFYESDVEASAEDIRKRLLELREEKSKAADEADDPVPSRTVFDEFQEYRNGEWVTLRNRPGRAGKEETLTPNQVELLIIHHMDPRSGNEASTREEAIARINPSVLPKAYMPQAVEPPPAGEAGTGAGAGAAPKKSTRVGARATVTYGGRKVPLMEVVESIKDEGSPQAAYQGLVSRGVPPESARTIVGLAFPGSV